MLLRQFVDGDGLLWVYEKNKEPRRGNPENECVERDFFEFEFRGRKTNNRFEKWLSKIEADATTLLPAIIGRRSLVPSEAQVWATFVALLFGRTRKVRTQISDAMTEKLREQIESADFIRDMQLELLKKGELRYADDLKKEFTELLTAMNESPSFYHVSALPNRARIIAEPLLSRAWHTIEAPPGQYFLVSDCPVVTYEMINGKGHTGAGFANENAVTILPVSPTHAFIASPHHLNWRTVATISGAMTLNRLIIQFAHRNVYSNIESAETRAWVDTEIDVVNFGKNAFLPVSKS
jgi:hypothetical protein